MKTKRRRSGHLHLLRLIGAGDSSVVAYIETPRGMRKSELIALADTKGGRPSGYVIARVFKRKTWVDHIQNLWTKKWSAVKSKTIAREWEVVYPV